MLLDLSINSNLTLLKHKTLNFIKNFISNDENLNYLMETFSNKNENKIFNGLKKIIFRDYFTKIDKI
jgi:hypothetical protein